MFVNQEITDHFPGEFTNVYFVELLEDIESCQLKKGQKIELEGKNNIMFSYILSGKEYLIEKNKAKIIKKMIKSVKKKS